MAKSNVAKILGLRERAAGDSQIRLISSLQKGLPIAALDRVCTALSPDDANFKYRIVPKASLARRKLQHRLSVDESTRLARLAKVWSHACTVWGGGDEARDFLFRPHQLLEGKLPIDVILASEFGGAAVDDILGRLEHGSAV